MDVKSMTNYLIKQLKKEGIVIQHYSAITTNSAYIKLDYGVLNSIRISDHKGKKHLKYKYNIQTDTTWLKPWINDAGRLFYPAKDIDKLVQRILLDRLSKQARYGDRYESFMEENLKNNQSKNGFWKESVLV